LRSLADFQIPAIREGGLEAGAGSAVVMLTPVPV